MIITADKKHPDYDPNVDYIGPMNWPDWSLKLINGITLGEFNYAAFLHDLGANANTKILRDENDKAFYFRLDAIVDAEKSFFKRQYLRFFKHFFSKAVRLNPGHYDGDEMNIKIERQLDAKLVEYVNAYESKMKALEYKLERASKLREVFYTDKNNLDDEMKDIQRMINLRNMKKLKDNPPSELVRFKNDQLERKKVS